jgi:hypothetical protein
MILCKLARLAALAALAVTSAAAMADAASLRTKFSELRDELRSTNAYHRPIHIDSVESGDTLKGDVYAIVDHPYNEFAGALKDPKDWCAILVLPFNTRSCRASGTADNAMLALRIGRKPDQPVQDAYQLDLHLQPVAAKPDYFESRLTAAQGPAGTRDYRITLEAVPLDERRSFMHLSYSYASGGMGRMAMQAYLSTAGANKVGFTVAGRDANGQPVYVGGVRGVIERNVMRHYLAVEAHLASLKAAPGERLEKRLETWFDSAERYGRQLHEMDRAQYMALKRGDAGSQQAQLEAPSRPSTRMAE